MNRYPSEIRQHLIANIYIRGGGANIRGIEDRIRRDIEQNVILDGKHGPMKINTHVSANPITNTWTNLHNLVNERKTELEPFWITKKEYEECGDNAELLKPFAFTNK